MERATYYIGDCGRLVRVIYKKEKITEGSKEVIYVQLKQKWANK